MARGEVVIRLDVDEALVLFEWLARTDESTGYAGIVDDQAERIVLWNLHGVLERELVGSYPGGGEYEIQLDAARERVKVATP